MTNFDTYLSAWDDEDGQVYVASTHDLEKANIEAKKYFRENVGEEEAAEFSFTEEDVTREWWDEKFFHSGEEYIPEEMISDVKVEGWVPVIRQSHF